MESKILVVLSMESGSKGRKLMSRYRQTMTEALEQVNEFALSHTVRYRDPLNKKRFAVPFKTAEKAKAKMDQLKRDGVKEIEITKDTLRGKFKEDVEIQESDAYDNNRYMMKRYMGQILARQDNSNTKDGKDHVYAPNAKIAKQLYSQGKKVYREKTIEEAKYPHKMYSKDGKEVEAKTPADHEKYAKMGYTHKNETHSFMTKDMNKSKKDAKGEKEIVDPAPKMKFKEAYKKVKKEAMNTVGDATADQANQRVGEGPKENDPDIKKPKAKADTGSKATPIDTSPEVEYKN